MFFYWGDWLSSLTPCASKDLLIPFVFCKKSFTNEQYDLKFNNANNPCGDCCSYITFLDEPNFMLDLGWKVREEKTWTTNRGICSTEVRETLVSCCPRLQGKPELLKTIQETTSDYGVWILCLNLQHIKKAIFSLANQSYITPLYTMEHNTVIYHGI